MNHFGWILLLSAIVGVVIIYPWTILLVLGYIGYWIAANS